MMDYPRPWTTTGDAPLSARASLTSIALLELALWSVIWVVAHSL
jgi:hypothetical protein